MMSPSHFFDTAFGGSAHGVVKGGLTEAGREMVSRMEAGDDRRCRACLVGHDRRRAGHRGAPGRRLAHRASGRRPTTCATCPTTTLGGIAATGGLVGIGFWPTASGGDDAAAIARSVGRHRAGGRRGRRAGLGLRRRGARCRSMRPGCRSTEALLEEGFDDDDIAAVMGGNAVRVLADALPD